MGVLLFHRTTRKVELTVAGERFLDRARRILADVDDAVTEAGQVAQGMLGRIAIGFTGSATYDLLPALVRVLRADLPGIELDIHGEMLTPDQVAALADGSLDLGLLRPPVRGADVEVHVLRREPLIAVLPERHPLAGRDRVQLSDLRDDPFITYPARRSVVYEAVIDACQHAGFVPAARHEVAETSTLVSFVAAGLGSRWCRRRCSICGSPGRPTCRWPGRPGRWSWPWPPGPGRPPPTWPGSGPGLRPSSATPVAIETPKLSIASIFVFHRPARVRESGQGWS